MSTLHEVRDRLEELASQGTPRGPGSVLAAARNVHAQSPSRRLSRWSSIAAAIVLLVAAGAGVGWMAWPRDHRQRITTGPPTTIPAIPSVPSSFVVPRGQVRGATVLGDHLWTVQVEAMRPVATSSLNEYALDGHLEHRRAIVGEAKALIATDHELWVLADGHGQGTTPYDQAANGGYRVDRIDPGSRRSKVAFGSSASDTRPFALNKVGATTITVTYGDTAAVLGEDGSTTQIGPANGAKIVIDGDTLLAFEMLLTGDPPAGSTALGVSRYRLDDFVHSDTTPTRVPSDLASLPAPAPGSRVRWVYAAPEASGRRIAVGVVLGQRATHLVGMPLPAGWTLRDDIDGRHVLLMKEGVTPVQLALAVDTGEMTPIAEPGLAATGSSDIVTIGSSSWLVSIEGGPGLASPSTVHLTPLVH